ncbi:MAG: hypothetical protein ACXWIU_09045 [Limisphaerales bacterium]
MNDFRLKFFSSKMFLLPSTSGNFWQLVARWRNFVEGFVSTFMVKAATAAAWVGLRERAGLHWLTLIWREKVARKCCNFTKGEEFFGSE